MGTISVHRALGARSQETTLPRLFTRGWQCCLQAHVPWGALSLLNTVTFPAFMLSRVSVASASMVTAVAPASWGGAGRGGEGHTCVAPSPQGWLALMDGMQQKGWEASLAVCPGSEGRAREVVRGLEPEDPVELYPISSPTGTRRQEVCAPSKCQDVGSLARQPWVISSTGSVVCAKES